MRLAAMRLGREVRSTSFKPISRAIDLIYTQRAFVAELLEHFADRWENKAEFYDESGSKVAENTIKEMFIMLTKHVADHTHMIKHILEVNKQ